MQKLSDKIWDYHVIQCNHCLQFDMKDRAHSKKEFAETLESCGWTINAHGAVKCGPCNWKDEEKKNVKNS